MSSQLAAELIEMADLQAAAHVPLEEGQAPSNDSSANNHRQDSTPDNGLLHSALDNGPMIKITLWRLLNTVVLLGLGIYKAVAAYLGQQTALTTLDWVIGVFWAIMGYWVSFLEDAQLGPRGRWFFTQDQSGVVLSILTIRMILHSDPGEIDTASPLHVPHSIIVITHDDRRDGFSGSDQTGHGSAPDFSTTIVATSAPDSSSGSSQTAPLELGEIVEAPANIEGSANLRERIKSDSGTLDTNGYRSSAYSMTSGERFICGVCGKDFSRAHDRKRHHETQHAATPVTHKCIYCEKDFSRADSLKRHIQNGCDEAPQQ